MSSFAPTVSRRTFLHLMSGTALAHGLGFAKTADASIPVGIPYAPPPVMTKTGAEAVGYKASLKAFITTIKDAPSNPNNPYHCCSERLLDTSITFEDAEAVQEVFALDGLSRSFPFHSGPNQAEITLLAPAYQDASNRQPDAPNVGPTMEFIRGEATAVWMTNNLSVCGPSQPTPVTPENIGHTPHNFNWTNLHTHGLHIEPNAPSDDVLVTIKPNGAPDTEHAHNGSAQGTSAHGLAVTAEDPATFPYYYNMRADHPVGTFWYHPHMHGSVASQVGPGMAGALITRSQSGQTDFDEILEAACGIRKAQGDDPGDERIMVLQTFQYNAVSGDDQSVDGVYSANNYYKTAEAPTAENCFGLTGIATDVSSAQTSVNGLVNPVMMARAGEILRLRIINATNGESYVPIFTADGATGPDVYAIAVDGIALLPVGAGLSAIDLPIDLSGGLALAAQNPFAEDTPYFHIDYGLTDTPETHSLYWTTAEIVTLAAAQRLDLLVQIPADAAEGQVFQLSGATVGDAPTVVTNKQLNTDPLVQIQVSGGPRSDQSIPTMQLFDNAQNRGTIERPPIAPSGNSSAPTATQSLWFGYVADDNIPTQKQGKVGNFLINGEAFDADLEDLGQVQLKKDELTAWELYSVDGPHIFHIHINSFAVHGRYYVDGDNIAGTPGWSEDQTINDQTVKGWPYATQSSWPSPSWSAPYLMPIWRDTLYFDSEGSNPGNNGSDYGVTGMRALTTSYQVDYTGEFVLHCHKLFHEDNGMMYTVQITES